jgi:hypothetical protein
MDVKWILILIFFFIKIKIIKFMVLLDTMEFFDFYDYLFEWTNWMK